MTNDQGTTMWEHVSETWGGPVDLVRRLCVTVVAAAVVVAATFLPVPFTEIAGASFYGLPRHPLTIGALGILPFAIGAVFVEAIASVWTDSDTDLAFDANRPAWIGRATAVAGVGIAAVYGLQIAAYWFSMLPAEIDGPVRVVSETGAFRWFGTAASIAAGSGLYYLVARWVSRSGIGDGFAVVLGTGIVWEVVPASRQFEDWLRGMSFQNLDVFAILGNILAVSFVILGTLWAVERLEEWVTRARPGADPEGDETDEGFRPRQAASTPFHAPIAGVLPFAGGLAALWLFWLGRTVFGADSLRRFGAGLETIPHASTVPFFLQEFALVVGLGALLGWLFVRADAARAEVDAETLGAWKKRAQLAALGFVALLVGVDVFGGPLVRSIGVVNLVLGTAVAYDLVRECQFRYAFEEVVAVRRIHRTGAVGREVEALTAEGIPTVVRGRAFRSMLRVLGAFTPHVVFVPASCRDAAASVLERPEGCRGDDD